MSTSFGPSVMRTPHSCTMGQSSAVFSQHAAHILTMEKFPSGVQKKLLLEYNWISCSKKPQKGIAFFKVFLLKYSTEQNLCLCMLYVFSALTEISQVQETQKKVLMMKGVMVQMPSVKHLNLKNFSQWPLSSKSDGNEEMPL